MNNKKLPKGNEWKKIVDDAFSSDSTHIFSDAYCNRRADLQRGAVMKRVTSNQKRSYKGIAATAAAMILIPTVTIAGTHFAVHKDGNSNDKAAEVVVEATTETTEALTEIVTEPVMAENGAMAEESDKGFEHVNDYELQFVNTDGFETDGFKYHKAGIDASGGITPDGPYRAKDFDAFKEAMFNQAAYSSSGKTEEYIIDMDENASDRPPMKVYVSKRAFDENDDYVKNSTNGYFDRDVAIQFLGSQYCAHLYVHTSITDEDLRYFIEGLRFVPCDPSENNNDVAAEPIDDGNNADTETTDISPVDVLNGVTPSGKYTLPDGTEVQTFAINDTFKDEYSHYTGADVDCSITDFWVQDNFDGFTTNGIGMDEDMSVYTAPDGSIDESKIDWYLGTDSLKVVVVELTYTNNSDVDCEPCISPVLEGYGYDAEHRYDESRIFGAGIDLKDTARKWEQFAMAFKVAEGSHVDKNEILLHAHETAKIHLAFLAQEKNLDNLYMNYDGINIKMAK